MNTLTNKLNARDEFITDSFLSELLWQDQFNCYDFAKLVTAYTIEAVMTGRDLSDYNTIINNAELDLEVIFLLFKSEHFHDLIVD